MNQEVTVYELGIVLLDTSPRVWRRLLIPSSATLTDLHLWSAKIPSEPARAGR